MGRGSVHAIKVVDSSPNRSAVAANVRAQASKAKYDSQTRGEASFEQSQEIQPPNTDEQPMKQPLRAK